MKNKLLFLTFGIFLISFTSAIYSGECSHVKFPNQVDVNFTLILNTTPIDGFSWNKTGYEINYCFSKDFPVGNYTFQWSNNAEPESPQTIVVYQSSGSRVRTITKVINNTIQKIIPIENKTIKYINNTVPEIQTIEKKVIPFWWGFIIFGIMVILFFLIKWFIPMKGGLENE